MCAEMLYDVEEARSLTYFAAWAADAEPDSLPLAAAMAKSRASDAAWSVCKASIQVHGGIGFTWEHDLHFLLKRARAGGQLFGTSAQHRDRIASLAGTGVNPLTIQVKREPGDALADPVPLGRCRMRLGRCRCPGGPQAVRCLYRRFPGR